MDLQLNIRPFSWAKKAILDRKSRAIACSAGLGSGKTFAAMQWHLTRCFDNYPARFSCIVEPTYHKIFDTAVPTFREVAELAGLQEYEHFRVYKSPHPKIVLFTGQEIHLLSGQRPDTIVGVKYSHGTIDEADEQEVEVFRNVQSRLRDKQAKYHQVMAVGSPQGIRWFADMFDSEGGSADWVQLGDRDWKNPTRSYRRFRARTYDNPELPKRYVMDLYDAFGHNPAYIKAYVEGIFCPLFTGNAYICFKEDRHIGDFTPEKHLTINLTWDFNVELVWTAFQMQWFDFPEARQKKFVVTNECEDGCTTFDDAIYSFAKAFPPSKWKDTPIHIYGDRSGHAHSHKVPETDFERILIDLRRFYNHVEIRASNKVFPEIGTVEAMNRAFSKDELLIDRRCTGLIRSIQATRWKDGIKKLDKPLGDTWTHRSDSVKYPIYQLSVADILSPSTRSFGLNL